jgi:hypothetical protein
MNIQKDFEKFHLENPHIYEMICKLAREWKKSGHEKASIKMFFEVIRWKRGVSTKNKDYKINNNYHSRYSRLIIDQEPDLRELFEVRKLHS